jgi:outer membrane lipoprotein-sorting protein/peroxiredoxin
MYRTGILAAGMIAIVSSAHADPELAQKRLAASQAALKEAKSLSFVLKVEAKGMISVGVDGKVDMQRQVDTGGRWIARLQGTSALSMSLNEDEAEKVPYNIVIDGEYYTWIDHENKRVMQRVGKGARDRQITVAKQYAWIAELADADPFHLADKSYETIDLTGQETVEGVECDVIVLDEGKNKAKQTWYIATSDNLPRRLHRQMGGMLDNSYTIVNLKVNSELDPSTFEIKTPEGYTEDKLGSPVAATVSQGVAPAPLDTTLVRDAAAFELKDSDGNTVKLEDYKGKVVVLEFLITYSGVSRHSGPEMKTFLEAVADKPVKVLSLPVKERDAEKTAAYFEKFGLTQTVLHGGDDTAMSYIVRRYPTYVVVDAEGKVAYETGYIKEESFPAMLAEIEKLLNGDAEGDGGDSDAK